ncbi:MAG: hypothetical protein ACI845_000258 [Gammaproteobacteria bacterium]|jgi:hypothetical protein
MSHQGINTLSQIRIFCFGCLFLLVGCANLGVKPWQRDLHAEPEMATDTDALDLSLDEHIYFSKEASSGGQGFGGGGCGCN